MLTRMTHVVRTKGQVVIPQRIREKFNLRPGTEVDFELLEDAVAVIPVGREGSLKGAFAGHGLVAALMDDRRLEPR